MKTKTKKPQSKKEIEEWVEMIVEISTLPDHLYQKYRNSGMSMEEVWELISKTKTQEN